jgi:hypothetical protein
MRLQVIKSLPLYIWFRLLLLLVSACPLLDKRLTATIQMCTVHRMTWRRKRACWYWGRAKRISRRHEGG